MKSLLSKGTNKLSWHFRGYFIENKHHLCWLAYTHVGKKLSCTLFFRPMTDQLPKGRHEDPCFRKVREKILNNIWFPRANGFFLTTVFKGAVRLFSVGGKWELRLKEIRVEKTGYTHLVKDWVSPLISSEAPCCVGELFGICLLIIPFLINNIFQFSRII